MPGKVKVQRIDCEVSSPATGADYFVFKIETDATLQKASLFLAYLQEAAIFPGTKNMLEFRKCINEAVNNGNFELYNGFIEFKLPVSAMVSLEASLQFLASEKMTGRIQQLLNPDD